MRDLPHVSVHDRISVKPGSKDLVKSLQWQAVMGDLGHHRLRIAAHSVVLHAASLYSWSSDMQGTVALFGLLLGFFACPTLSFY